MANTVAGVLLTGTHAARPAGNAVPDGTLYSCTTHSLIYQSNYAGNSWATWATLGTGTAPTGYSAAPSGNVSIPNTSTWTDICSVSLAAGTYIGWGVARLNAATANNWGVRLYDGTNELGGSESPTSKVTEVVFTKGPFTLGSTTTVKLQGVAVDALTVVQTRPDFTGNPATYATFLKIA